MHHFGWREEFGEIVCPVVDEIGRKSMRACQGESTAFRQGLGKEHQTSKKVSE